MTTKLDELRDELPEHVIVGARHTAQVTGQASLDELTKALERAYVDDPEPWLTSALCLPADQYDTFEELVNKAHTYAKNHRPKIRKRRS